VPAKKGALLKIIRLKHQIRFIMKLTATALLCLLWALPGIKAQNFEPAPGMVQTKIEKLIARYGTPERVYLTDVAQKTFEAQGGLPHIVVFSYNSNSTAKRRMMVYEIGSGGEKKNPKYPNSSKAWQLTPSMHAFSVRLDPQGDQATKTTYKIDTDATAEVYIYRLIQGVK
jgi:hypothetical protein